MRLRTLMSSALVTVAGHVLMVTGICLVLQPSPVDVGLAAVFGVLVAGLRLAGERWLRARVVLPVAAAFLVTAVTLLLVRHDWTDADCIRILRNCRSAMASSRAHIEPGIASGTRARTSSTVTSVSGR